MPLSQTYTITVNISDPDGTPVDNAEIKIRLVNLGNESGSAIAPIPFKKFTDEDGYAEFELWPNDQVYSNTYYEITSWHPVKKTLIHNKNAFLVTGDADVSDLIFAYAGSTPIDPNQLLLDQIVTAAADAQQSSSDAAVSAAASQSSAIASASSATSSQNSAVSSAASATTAGQSASTASNFATSANTSAAAASASQAAAATSATNAANSENTAGQAAFNAVISENNAASSATSAANSATSASASATAASVSESSASASAASASTSVSNASTSETNAAGSATSASTSASSAATSAMNAATSEANAAASAATAGSAALSTQFSGLSNIPGAGLQPSHTIANLGAIFQATGLGSTSGSVGSDNLDTHQKLLDLPVGAVVTSMGFTNTRNYIATLASGFGLTFSVAADRSTTIIKLSNFNNSTRVGSDFIVVNHTLLNLAAGTAYRVSIAKLVASPFTESTQVTQFATNSEISSLQSSIDSIVASTTATTGTYTTPGSGTVSTMYLRASALLGQYTFQGQFTLNAPVATETLIDIFTGYVPATALQLPSSQTIPVSLFMVAGGALSNSSDLQPLLRMYWNGTSYQMNLYNRSSTLSLPGAGASYHFLTSFRVQ